VKLSDDEAVLGEQIGHDAMHDLLKRVEDLPALY
jgi:hypothetical protein